MKRVFAAALGTLLVALWTLSGRGQLGVPGEWTIAPNGALWPPGAWGLPLVVLALFGGAAGLSVYDRFKRAKTRQEQTNSTRTALVALALLGLLWPWTLLGPGALTRQNISSPTQLARVTLEGRFNVLASLWSDVATQYFGEAYTISDARNFCHLYAQREQNPPSRALAHVATHPPGATLLFYGARRFAEEVPGLNAGLNALACKITGQDEPALADLLAKVRVSSSRGAGAPDPPPLPRSAIGVALLCAFGLGASLVLALPAVYGLAAGGPNEHGQAEARGLLACALWVLAPSLNLFAFSLDAVVAALVAWTLFFAARAATTGRKRFVAATGLALALATMLSFGALVVGGIVLVAWFLLGRRDALRLGVGSAGTFVSAWIGAALWGGCNPVEVALRGSAAHHYATLSVRHYWPWAVLNLLVWAVFCGSPLVVCALDGARRAKELIIRSGTLKSASSASEPFAWGPGAFALATILVLVLLSLSGQVRGEVERLWLFLLAPLVACARVRSAKEAGALVVLQGVQTLVMAATLAPLVRPF